MKEKVLKEFDDARARNWRSVHLHKNRATGNFGVTVATRKQGKDCVLDERNKSGVWERVRLKE